MSTLNITTPVGRMVMGSLYEPSTTDMKGNLLTIKSGPNAGQPKVEYWFNVAIPKGNERHWNQTDWGQKIYAHAQLEFPQGNWQQPSFAWKIENGDSTVLNENNRRPCDREGYPDNWVLSMKSGFAPKLCNANGSQVLLEKDAIKPGYYIQVNLNVSGNGGPPNAGLFLNPSIVALAGYGEEISFGPDPTQAGFGGAALPLGASATPIGGLDTLLSATMPVAPVAPVAPNPAFLQVPAVPPSPVEHKMTDLAGGATYEAFIAKGWTDAQLVQQGFMAP